MLTRRRFIAALFAAVAVAAFDRPALAWFGHARSLTPEKARDVARRIKAAVPGAQWTVLGSRFMEQHPEATPAAMAGALAGGWSADDLARADAERIRALLRAAIREDFRKGAFFEMDGFRYALTEARLGAVIASKD